MDRRTITAQSLGLARGSEFTVWQSVGKSRPDAVFLDLGMPGMDGVEVARRIRQHRDLDSVRLVALTGLGQATDRRRTQDAGINHHLVKPASMRDLQSLLA